LITFIPVLYSQEKDKEYFLGIADSIVLSQCTEGFYEILNKNKQYSFQRRVDLTDPRIDLDNQKYTKNSG